MPAEAGLVHFIDVPTGGQHAFVFLRSGILQLWDISCPSEPELALTDPRQHDQPQVVPAGNMLATCDFEYDVYTYQYEMPTGIGKPFIIAGIADVV